MCPEGLNIFLCLCFHLSPFPNYPTEKKIQSSLTTSQILKRDCGHHHPPFCFSPWWKNLGVNRQCFEIHNKERRIACANCTMFVSVSDTMCVSVPDIAMGASKRPLHIRSFLYCNAGLAPNLFHKLEKQNGCCYTLNRRGKFSPKYHF